MNKAEASLFCATEVLNAQGCRDVCGLMRYEAKRTAVTALEIRDAAFRFGCLGGSQFSEVINMAMRPKFPMACCSFEKALLHGTGAVRSESGVRPSCGSRVKMGTELVYHNVNEALTMSRELARAIIPISRILRRISFSCIGSQTSC